MDRWARVLGATGTALTAAFGIYKGIYYADRNLPERLKQLLGRTDSRLRQDRAPLLAATNYSGPGARSHKSVFYVGPLNVALAELRFPRLDSADRQLKEALQLLQEQLAVSEGHKNNIIEQKVAAHVLRGSIASARAEYKLGEGISPDEDHDAAEAELTLAIELRPGDLDALELRGRQREICRHYDGAREDFEALTDAAQKAGAHLRAARGFRLQGELKEKRATARKALTEARGRFGLGIAAINAKGSLSEADRLEKGRLHLAYGRIQKRLAMRTARVHLENARDCFKDVRTSEARDLLIEVENLLKELELPTLEMGATSSQKSEARISWLRRLLG